MATILNGVLLVLRFPSMIAFSYWMAAYTSAMVWPAAASVRERSGAPGNRSANRRCPRDRRRRFRAAVVETGPSPGSTGACHHEIAIAPFQVTFGPRAVIGMRG